MHQWISPAVETAVGEFDGQPVMLACYKDKETATGEVGALLTILEGARGKEKLGFSVEIENPQKTTLALVIVGDKVDPLLTHYGCNEQNVRDFFTSLTKARGRLLLIFAYAPDYILWKGTVKMATCEVV